MRLHSDCTAAAEITPTAMAGDKERCLGSNASESAGLCKYQVVPAARVSVGFVMEQVRACVCDFARSSIDKYDFSHNYRVL